MEKERWTRDRDDLDDYIPHRPRELKAQPSRSAALLAQKAWLNGNEGLVLWGSYNCRAMVEALVRRGLATVTKTNQGTLCTVTLILTPAGIEFAKGMKLPCPTGAKHRVPSNGNGRVAPKPTCP